jgi:hypothetical protein
MAASTYEIKYNGNGNTSGSMNNSIHTIGVSSNLNSNQYKKEYTFIVTWRFFDVCSCSKCFKITK